MKARIYVSVLTSALLGLFTAGRASATLTDLGANSFNPLASTITFSEFALGTVNPSITLATTTLGNVTVSFAGAFTGQTETGTSVVTLANVTPTAPLSLNLSTQAVTANDGASSTSPILSGTPTFNGPIAVLFSKPVAAVGLEGGYFDALNATSITAFNAAGQTLGTITNSQLGFQFYGLTDSSGLNDISGISFYITGNEPAGFDIDNLTFGSALSVPEPASAGLMICGLVGLARRRARRSNIVAGM